MASAVIGFNERVPPACTRCTDGGPAVGKTMPDETCTARAWKIKTLIPNPTGNRHLLQGWMTPLRWEDARELLHRSNCVPYEECVLFGVGALVWL